MDKNIVCVSTHDAKQRLSELVNQVFYGQRRVVITSRGKPKVAIVTLDELNDLDVSQSTQTAQGQNQEDGLALAISIRKEIAKAAKGKLTDPVTDLRKMRKQRDKRLDHDLR